MGCAEVFIDAGMCNASSSPQECGVSVARGLTELRTSKVGSTVREYSLRLRRSIGSESDMQSVYQGRYVSHRAFLCNILHLTFPETFVDSLDHVRFVDTGTGKHLIAKIRRVLE